MDNIVDESISSSNGQQRQPQQHQSIAITSTMTSVNDGTNVTQVVTPQIIGDYETDPKREITMLERAFYDCNDLYIDSFPEQEVRKEEIVEQTDQIHAMHKDELTEETSVETYEQTSDQVQHEMVQLKPAEPVREEEEEPSHHVSEAVDKIDVADKAQEAIASEAVLEPAASEVIEEATVEECVDKDNNNPPAGDDVQQPVDEKSNEESEEVVKGYVKDEEEDVKVEKEDVKVGNEDEASLDEAESESSSAAEIVDEAESVDENDTNAAVIDSNETKVVEAEFDEDETLQTVDVATIIDEEKVSEGVSEQEDATVGKASVEDVQKELEETSEDDKIKEELAQVVKNEAESRSSSPAHLVDDEDNESDTQAKELGDTKDANMEVDSCEPVESPDVAESVESEKVSKECPNQEEEVKADIEDVQEEPEKSAPSDQKHPEEFSQEEKSETKNEESMPQVEKTPVGRRQSARTSQASFKAIANLKTPPTASPSRSVTPRATREPKPKVEPQTAPRASTRTSARQSAVTVKTVAPIKLTIRTTDRSSISTSAPASQPEVKKREPITTANLPSTTTSTPSKALLADESKKYICEQCKFSTTRLNNMVYHRKHDCPYMLEAYNAQVNQWKKCMQTPKGNKRPRLN